MGSFKVKLGNRNASVSSDCERAEQRLQRIPDFVELIV
jgi:hypothetical protein